MLKIDNLHAETAGKQILAEQRGAARGHLITRPAAERVGERRLAGAVRPHDRVDLARVDLERKALEDGLVGDGRLKVVDLKHGSQFAWERVGGAGSHSLRPAPIHWRMVSTMA